MAEIGENVEAAPEAEGAVLELDELGSLVIDLRTAYDHPAAPEVAARHLERMRVAASEAHGDPPPPLPPS